jgi:hypothetical protein
MNLYAILDLVFTYIGGLFGADGPTAAFILAAAVILGALVIAALPRGRR